MESCVYLGPGNDYPYDSLQVLLLQNKVVETRDVPWQAPPVVEVLRSAAAVTVVVGAGRGVRTGRSVGARRGVGAGRSARARTNAWVRRDGWFRFRPADSIATAGEGPPPQLRAASPAVIEGHDGQGERCSIGGERLPALRDVVPRQEAICRWRQTSRLSASPSRSRRARRQTRQQ